LPIHENNNNADKCQIHFIIVLTFMVALAACMKEEFPDPNTLPKGLSGLWIETNTLSDTTRFNSDTQSGYFYLTRAKSGQGHRFMHSIVV
jgi:hypothetical protein